MFLRSARHAISLSRFQFFTCHSISDSTCICGCSTHRTLASWSSAFCWLAHSAHFLSWRWSDASSSSAWSWACPPPRRRRSRSASWHDRPAQVRWNRSRHPRPPGGREEKQQMRGEELVKNDRKRSSRKSRVAYEKWYKHKSNEPTPRCVYLIFYTSPSESSLRGQQMAQGNLQPNKVKVKSSKM